jgi:hypothetical protein
MIAFVSADTVIGAAVGFVAGAFTPAVGRTIKAWFSKEVAAVKADVVADVVKAEADVKAKI